MCAESSEVVVVMLDGESPLPSSFVPAKQGKGTNKTSGTANKLHLLTICAVCNAPVFQRPGALPADLQSGGVLPGVPAFHGEGPEGGEHGRLRSQPENHESCESLSVRFSTV